MLREKCKTYKKETLLHTIAEKSYLQQLEKRVNSKEKHLTSFADFVQFCEEIKRKLL